MKENWTFPCCKDAVLPAPLDGVAAATCPCGLSYDPKVIIAYNEMVDIITDWRDAVNGKVCMMAESGEDVFLVDLIRRSIKYAR
jgi:hypothetical protein